MIIPLRLKQQFYNTYTVIKPNLASILGHDFVLKQNE